ncbi:GNAT family N-acetyltransferase [Nocardioides sp.]|uniref:GNAT family N-acetyltransferase n=1 Tax=Nocardioides sp. TaxID=35761 RepID=UPI002B26C5A2|nr:GNAT family N-acetyltransferase [Nocardioides sp.]
MTSASIRLARPSDLRHLAGVEDAGLVLFEEHFNRTHAALASPAPSGGERDQAGTLLVADVGGEVVGFAHLTFADDRAHLEQVSVLPSYGRQGIGAALVRAVMSEARGSGHRELSLCTFADVPWNGPFYGTLGFVEVDDLEPFQVRLREHERALGLDGIGRRVVMRAPL